MMAASEYPRRGDRPHIVAESGPVLRQITVRAPTKAAHARRGGGRWLFGGVLVVVLIVGIVAGALGGRAWWKPKPLSSVAAAQAAVNAQVQPLFLNAYNLQREGKLGDAQQEFLEIVADDPVNYYAYYDLGLIYQETGHDSVATIDYEKALLINPKFQPALYNLASLETASNPSAAISLYEQLQALRPSNGAAVAFNLGLLYLGVGKTSAGVAQLKYAIGLDPALASRVPAKYESLLNPAAGATTGP